MPVPEQEQNPDPQFDRLIQRLRQQMDRRGLGRLAASALTAASVLNALPDDAETKKKKKKK
ncbi:MAG: hypothetical protein KC442_06150, partial [Thermomicrobiales bacterium]|nr:hypothetical protein [Thermomicrobiales bacterium]